LTKAQAVAGAINSLLQDLTMRCVEGAKVLDRFHVGVIGYGQRVGPILGGFLTNRNLVSISDVAWNALRTEQRPQVGPDGSVALAEVPVWFDAVADGNTPMGQAIELASQFLAEFLVDHPNCFPPIVINITDGKPTDRNPKDDAERLKMMSSTDGNVLLFNLHISETPTTPLLFPDSETALVDSYARLLFRMSSVLPRQLWTAAEEAGVQASEGTRGFVFNADIRSVVRALDIGTRVTKNLPAHR
jgi:hypothetical protein